MKSEGGYFVPINLVDDMLLLLKGEKNTVRNFEWAKDRFLNLDQVESYDFDKEELHPELSRAGIYGVIINIDLTSGSQIMIDEPEYAYSFASCVDDGRGNKEGGDTLRSLAYASLQYYNRLGKGVAE